MFNREVNESDFWSKGNELRELDLSGEETAEEILPGSGDFWMALWDEGFTAHEEAKWASFLSGDSADRSVVAWR